MRSSAIRFVASEASLQWLRVPAAEARPYMRYVCATFNSSPAASVSDSVSCVCTPSTYIGFLYRLF